MGGGNSAGALLISSLINPCICLTSSLSLTAHLWYCGHGFPNAAPRLGDVDPRKRYLLGGRGLRNPSRLHDSQRHPACLFLFPIPTSRHSLGHIIQPKDTALLDGRRCTWIVQSGGDSQKNSNRMQFVQLELELEPSFRVFDNGTYQSRQRHGQGFVDLRFQGDFHGAGKKSLRPFIKGSRRYLQRSHSCTASTRIPVQRASIKGGV